ncbi:hypothetical protein [Pseudacidobacterium ailaaui]|uniref:hypothetical protein n=1 Tax=Pseudacidobacterium ailaaui TaxID=1382359 RepID=UPI0012DC8BE2|nr:hypothetical protein [Pseudacidobacterium ailaaui]
MRFSIHMEFSILIPKQKRRTFWILSAAVCGILPLLAYGKTQSEPSADVSHDPIALVRRASRNELNSSNANHPYRYQLHKIDDGKITTKEIIETKEGDVARLIAVNDKPLDPAAEKAEIDRLNNLAAHPELQEHRRKKEQEDSDRANKMIRLLPDAFTYQYEGMVDGPNGPCYRLSFRPNPAFNPPDRESEVFAGMAGELWIDKAQERMVRLDAHLIADVNFGWGILGKLYKGGSILVEQADVGDHHWETTHMKLNLTGKALMIKPLSFQTTEDASHFEPVPADIGYQKAIDMLLKEDAGPQVARSSGKTS